MDMTLATTIVIAASSGMKVAANICVTMEDEGGGNKETIFSDKVRALGQQALMTVASVYGLDVSLIRTPFAIRVGDGDLFIFSVPDKKNIPGYFDMRFDLEIKATRTDPSHT